MNTVALMKDQERVAYHVKAYRVSRGWTQGELARRSGIAQPDVSAIENATTDHRLTKLSRVAKALDVDISALFAAVDEAVVGNVG